MREGVLYEITKDSLDTGLRGVPVGTCVTSYVDPYKGLSYVDHPIADLANRDPLEIIYLLYYGEMGSKAQLQRFHQELSQKAFLKEESVRAIEALPKEGSPMDVMAAALLITGMFESTNNYNEDALHLIAKLPHIAAVVINSHAGWGATPEPNPDLGVVESFLSMLQMPNKKSGELTQAMRLFHILHLDHNGGNLSTFVGKAVASGLEPLYGSLAAAMTALAGPRHGRANQDSLEFLQEIHKSLGDHATSHDVELFVREKLASGGLIYGFGHAVLRVEDPRATVGYEFCQKHFPHDPLVKMALMLRVEGAKVLSENPKISNPYPNIDAITGAMLMAAGFPYPEYYTVLFGMSRCVGIAIQIVYERLYARDGRGTPIVRPSYLYKPRR